VKAAKEEIENESNGENGGGKSASWRSIIENVIIGSTKINGSAIIIMAWHQRNNQIGGENIMA